MVQDHLVVYKSPTDQAVDDGIQRHGLVLTSPQRDCLRMIVNVMLRIGHYPVSTVPFWNEAVFDPVLLSWPYFTTPRVLSPKCTKLEIIAWLWKKTMPSRFIPGQAKSIEALRDQNGFVFHRNGEFASIWADQDGTSYHDRRCRRIDGVARVFKPKPACNNDPVVRRQFLDRHQRVCVSCNEISMTDLQVDHRTPRIRWLETAGGTEPYPNLTRKMSLEDQDQYFQPMCARCNESKTRACEKCQVTGKIRIPGVAERYPWRNRYPREYTGSCGGCYWWRPVAPSEGVSVLSPPKERDILDLLSEIGD